MNAQIFTHLPTPSPVIRRDNITERSPCERECECECWYLYSVTQPGHNFPPPAFASLPPILYPGQALWSDPDSRNIQWEHYTCANFTCLRVRLASPNHAPQPPAHSYRRGPQGFRNGSWGIVASVLIGGWRRGAGTGCPTTSSRSRTSWLSNPPVHNLRTFIFHPPSDGIV